MSHIYLSITFLSAFLLQVSFLGNLKILGLVPNILLILIVFLSFKRDIKKILPYTFIFGIFLDIAFGGFFGFYMLSFFFIAWISNLISKDGRSASSQRILAIIFLASLYYSIYEGIGLYTEEIGLSFRIILYLLGQIALNVFIAFIFMGVLDRFNDFLDKADNVSKQKVKI